MNLSLRHLLEHVGLLSSIALFLVVATKIYRVANGDVATAASLIQAAGPLNVSFGVVVTTLPYFFYMLGCASMMLLPRFEDGISQCIAILTWLGCVVILCVLGTWLDVAFMFLFPLIHVVMALVFLKWGDRIYARWEARDAAEAEAKEQGNKEPVVYWWRMNSWEYLVWLPMILVSIWPFAAAILSSHPWLPTERLALNGGSVRVGYVVARDEATMTVLDHGSRQISYVPIDGVQKRELCAPYLNAPRAASLWQVVKKRKHEPRYKTCWR